MVLAARTSSLRPAPLEHGDGHAVRRADRQQVHHRRGAAGSAIEWNTSISSRNDEQHDRADEVGQPVGDPVADVDVLGGDAAHVGACAPSSCRAPSGSTSSRSVRHEVRRSPALSGAVVGNDVDHGDVAGGVRAGAARRSPTPGVCLIAVDASVAAARRSALGVASTTTSSGPLAPAPNPSAMRSNACRCVSTTGGCRRRTRRARMRQERPREREQDHGCRRIANGHAWRATSVRPAGPDRRRRVGIRRGRLGVARRATEVAPVHSVDAVADERRASRAAA